MKVYMVIPKIEVQGANAMSCPYIVGFPAMTAWLGACHAMQRKMKIADEALKDFCVHGVAASCHSFNLKKFKDHFDTYNYLAGVRKPLVKNNKNNTWGQPAFIEEARADGTVSLLLEITGVDAETKEKAENAAESILAQMKLAGGDIMRYKKPEIYFMAGDAEMKKKIRHKILGRLMPGYVLIDRTDLLKDIHDEAGGDMLDALLKAISVHYKKERDEETFSPSKMRPGWLVPTAAGYRAISDVCSLDNQRDTAYPHKFVESIMTLGEFILPTKVNRIDDLLWHYEHDMKNYKCVNHKMEA